MTLTLIQNGDVYAPEPLGKLSVLLANDRIMRVGAVDVAALRVLGVPLDVIDAADCFVVPGLVDPHAHLIGAGGEQGFASRLPEITLEALVMAGVTTVIGLLGTDTVTREPKCLYAKVSQLRDEGLSAYMYTGGFELPPRTVTTSPQDDVVLVDPVIGLGEVAISDQRWIDPQLPDLAYAVAQTALGGRMSGKAGVTHFHVGECEGRLRPLNDLLDNYPIPPEYVYATHITRSEALMGEAVALAGRGAAVDMDSVEENIVDCLSDYLRRGGPPERLTVSSDAHTPGGSPAKFFRQFMACTREGTLGLDVALRHFSTNAADILKLGGKGRLHDGCDADVLVLRRDTLEIAHLFAGGEPFVHDGQIVKKSQQGQHMEASYQ